MSVCLDMCATLALDCTSEFPWWSNLPSAFHRVRDSGSTTNIAKFFSQEPSIGYLRLDSGFFPWTHGAQPGMPISCQLRCNTSFWDIPADQVFVADRMWLSAAYSLTCAYGGAVLSPFALCMRHCTCSPEIAVAFSWEFLDWELQNW